MRAISSHLATHAVAPHLEVMLTEYPQRDFSMVDVCGAGITKGSGLAAVAGQFGVAQSEVMAVGDNHNDRDMLEWAGIGVVMGNAEPELKAPGLSPHRHQRRGRPGPGDRPFPCPARASASRRCATNLHTLAPAHTVASASNR